MLAGNNPLIGKNDDEMGPRFPATSNAYPENLRQAAKHAAEKLGIDFLIPHGTYCFVSGTCHRVDAILQGRNDSIVKPTCSPF